MSRINDLWNGVRFDPQTGCWNWIHFKNPKGYGKKWFNGRKEMVHRIAMHLWRGFDLKSKLIVCHHCDNPACFNPKHLFVGTPLMNTQDAVSKGRFKTGPKGWETCKRGHPWTPENRYQTNCRLCMNINSAKWRKKRNATKQATPN